MIGKRMAEGARGEEARRRLVRAFCETVVLGPVTNRHFLIRLLEHPEFAAGRATTAFIGKHFSGAALEPPVLTERHWVLAAALLWRQSAERYPSALRGWRNSNPEPAPIRLAVGNVERTIPVTAHEAARVDTNVPFHIDGDDIVVDLDSHTVRFTDKTYEPPTAAMARSDGNLRAPIDSP